ncbi:hypothetical protein HMPREF1992_02171 [Selenomonas sp. oral taxon 892 str. F0426]|nr:hypothetical protein HMPREF1992_02171 [Selenomonas sp. oral taxon 892 str. F0426]
MGKPPQIKSKEGRRTECCNPSIEGGRASSKILRNVLRASS